MPAESHEQHPIVGPDHQLPAPLPPSPGSKLVRVVVWIVLLLIFAVGFYLVLRHHDDSSTSAAPKRGAGGGAVALTTATAQKGNIGVYLEAIGTVTPVYTASITSQVTGPVVAVRFKEGQTVRKGDPLIEIDPRPFEATLMQAQGVLERDQATLAQATMDLNRYRDAWSRNAIPKQTLDDQEKIVLQDAGTVKNDEGIVKFDQIQVGYCHIRAPIAGRVGLRLVDPGNVVQASGTTTLAVITQIQPITVIFTVPEDNLGQIQPRLRQQAKLPVEAFDRAALKQIATGTLLTLDNQIDTTTGTVKARASFENKDSSLFPNEFVNARLLVNTLQGATLIPTSAIQHNGAASFVYVLQNDTAHMRSVKPGVIEGETTQVTGINPGDVVANSSFDKLQDKTKVSVSNKPISAAATAGSSAP
ncbi:efflux RND transporter periplasmic adaptor subunit [Tunturibacter empetritectus]|uniref:Multidrug efflux system membrane fusion protein n=1 Tax=Tunturiibacter empetritectus TaxID=3069691 RepID=A0A7W8IHR5_9BACT|nr:efflux RND transporter periplasmic adaptor subunit [Edaphobacter lichenicola]MBB5317386.1 multidrug efflux system membrane fusion protein [Edaphobacter lichenicola]